MRLKFAALLLCASSFGNAQTALEFRSFDFNKDTFKKQELKTRLDTLFSALLKSNDTEVCTKRTYTKSEIEHILDMFEYAPNYMAEITGRESNNASYFKITYSKGLVLFGQHIELNEPIYSALYFSSPEEGSIFKIECSH